MIICYSMFFRKLRGVTWTVTIEFHGQVMVLSICTLGNRKFFFSKILGFQHSRFSRFTAERFHGGIQGLSVKKHQVPNPGEYPRASGSFGSIFFIVDSFLFLHWFWDTLRVKRFRKRIIYKKNLLGKISFWVLNSLLNCKTGLADRHINWSGIGAL